LLVYYDAENVAVIELSDFYAYYRTCEKWPLASWSLPISRYHSTSKPCSFSWNYTFGVFINIRSHIPVLIQNRQR